ncbi:MAG: phage integrase N-terminal SAM-like domain-containing protein [Desulfurivibrionaceae bacterium]
MNPSLYSFFDCRIHPRDLGTPDVERFLSDRAVKPKVSASIRRQPLNVTVFQYRQVIDKPLDGKIGAVRSGNRRKDVFKQVRQKLYKSSLFLLS